MDTNQTNGSGALTAEGLVLKSLEGMGNNINEIKKEVAGRMAKEDFDKSITELKSQMAADAAKYESFTNEQKAAFDQLKGVVETIEKKGGMFNVGNATKAPTFKSAYAEAVESRKADLAKMEKGSGSVTLEVKADVMTTGNSLNGDGVITYNVRQALIPGQKVNFRNLIPSTISPTREYVTFKQGTTVGTPDWQVEGEEKATIEYNFDNVLLLNEYLAGVVTFSKQLMKSLPWLNGTLPRLLLNDFYRKENAEFYADAVAAGTPFVPAATGDVEATIQAIGYMASTDFQPSFGVVNPVQWAALAVGTYTGQTFGGSGAVIIEASGAITIAGVPIIAASWVPNDKLLLIDSMFVERVEAESVNVTFSFEHSNNFTKNQVTAKIECMEVLNVMLPGAVLVMDYGNAT